MGNVTSAAIAVVAGIIGLAIVAVLVGRNSQTSSVIQSGGSALAGIINAAVSPVSANTSNLFGSGR